MTRIYFPVLMLCAITLFFACVEEAELELHSEVPQAEFKSNTPTPPVFECEESLPPPCDCKFKVNYVSNSTAEWSLKTYGAGGPNANCCINGNTVENLNIGENCGILNNYPIGQWANLPCGLRYGNFGLLFKSKNCFGCIYASNSISLTVSCTNGAGGENSRNFSIQANNNSNCTEQTGVWLTSVNANNCSL